MFSTHWTQCNNDNEIENCDSQNSNDNTKKEGAKEEIVFIDKDPESFQYILNYMREGYIDLPKDNLALTKRIILQAQYFGLDDILQSIKVRSVKNFPQAFGVKSSLSFDESEMNDIVSRFDDKYGSLTDAFDDGCLPSSYFEKFNNQVSFQVGDTKYTFNRYKVMSKSALMERLIQSSSDAFTTLTEVLYIDQDPEAFKFLVHYIRYSQIDLPRDDSFLFQRILCCAQELEMADFITFIKARTMRNIERSQAPLGLDPTADHDSPHVLLDSVTDVHRQYASEFDRRFRSISVALEQNVLPRRFFYHDI
mmetsp:Transcript_23592/g.35081  ORF Transcript_23592/g.35081 Transcript_23592/m.35081 type:complete len:308 (-) Transcript_23592:40-963(-)